MCVCIVCILYVLSVTLITFSQKKVKSSYPRNRPWRPIELSDVKDLTLSNNRLTDGGKVVSPTHRPPFTSQKHYLYISGTHFCLRPSEEQGLMLLEGLGKLKKIIHLFGPRTRDLLACSILP
jgi:hypothetical protein